MTKILNPRGMSLIEVMIVMTIMSLIGLGTATLMKNMFSIQRRGNLKATAKEIKNNLEVILKNDTAWANSVNAVAGACLQDAIGNCPHRPYSGNPSAPGAPLAANQDIYNADGSIYFQATSATAGFDAETGAACATFNAAAGAGDDACPFRYTIGIYTECPGGVGPCNKPQVTIVGVLLFNPADPSDPRNRINLSDYTIVLKRGERSRYEPLEISYKVAGQTGGGDCPQAQVNTPLVRPLNTVEYDVGGNVVGSANLAGGEFTLAPGTYECKVVAQGYEAIDGFFIRLQNTVAGTNVITANAYCGYNSTCYASGTGQFNITSNVVFRLTHTCGQDPGGEPDSAHDYVEPYEMGIPSVNASGGYGGAGGESVYTTVTCVRSS